MGTHLRFSGIVTIPMQPISKGQPLEVAEHTRVDVLLELWAEWMRHGGDIARWYPNNACGMDGAGKMHTEDFYRGIEVDIATTVDTIVHDLGESHRAAIRHCYLGDKYAGYLPIYWDLVTTAKEIIKQKAEEKGIY